MYRPHTQFRFGDANAPGVSAMTWVIRTEGDPSAAVSFARAAVRRVDADLGISDVETMDQVVDDATSDRRVDPPLFAPPRRPAGGPAAGRGFRRGGPSLGGGAPPTAGPRGGGAPPPRR